MGLAETDAEGLALALLWEADAGGDCEGLVGALEMWVVVDVEWVAVVLCIAVVDLWVVVVVGGVGFLVVVLSLSSLLSPPPPDPLPKT
jgi:hypothetical protein